MTPHNQFTAAQPYVIMALLVTSIVGAMIYSASAYGALTIPSGNEPAVIIEIQPLSNGKAVTLGKDLAVVVFITAPLPPNMLKESERDTKVVFAGIVERGVVLTRNEIGPIIDDWVMTYKERGNRNRPYIGLSVHVDIVDRATGESIATGIESVTLNTDLLSKGNIGYYKLGIGIDTPESGRVAPMGLVEVKYYDVLTAPDFTWMSTTNYVQESGGISATQSDLDGYDWCVPLQIHTYRCYNLAYYADVETLANALPGDYFKTVNGVKYVKIPVLIAVNDFPAYSATVIVSIGSETSNYAIGVYPTYSVGSNIATAIKTPNYPVFPSVTVWKGDGIVWGGEEYSFYRNLILRPIGERSSGWVWIYGRPYIEIYSVYSVWLDHGVNYERDEVTFAISDVLVSNGLIESGKSYGLPSDSLMSYFFAGTEEVGILNLSPGESVPLNHVFQSFDKCGADFEIGIPVGAMIAVAASVLFPISAPVAAGLSGFQISVSAVSASIRITGGIENEGDDPDYAGDHDAVEIVYVRISKFRYKVDPPWWCFWCSTCYYDVPAGIYFRFY